MELMQRIERIILVLLLAVLPVFAQKADVRGVVTDSLTGEKIPYANIAVIGTVRGAVTNNNGFYLLANLPHGTYDVVATSLGYEPRKRSVTVKGKEPITLNFALGSKPVEVNEVLVTGGRKKELEEINTSVHVLDTKELQKVPVAAQGDLFRSIQIIPGIVSSADVSSKFFVRGGAGDQNLIYFDGMKIYNPYHAFGIFSIFDPDIVKTTEVYTGAFPPGYGGRLSSVINIGSRDGNTQGVHGSVVANMVSGKVSLEGPLIGSSNWIVSARKSLFSDSFKKFLKDPPPISFYDVFAKVNLGGGEFGRYSIQTFVSGDDILSPDPNEADHRWRSTSSALTISNLIENHIYFDATVYGSSYTIRRDAKQSTLVRPAESQIADGGIRGEVTMYTDSRDLYFIGFDVNVPSYKYSFINTSNIVVNKDETTIETWAWFRYQFNLDRIKADIGFHSDIIALFGGGNLRSILQPRVNVSYLFDNDWKAKFSFGTFTQHLITLTNEDDVLSLFEAWIFIPENLEPESATHYVAGIGGNLYSELSIDVQAYYKDYTSLVGYNRNKRFYIDPDYINGTGSSYGFETLFRYQYSFLDLYLAYTLGWTSVTFGDFTYTPRYDRRHTVNILNVTHVTDAIDLSVRWELGSGYPFTQTTGVYDRSTLSDLGRSDVVTDNGRPYTVLGEKNAARLPVYHRLDLTATYALSFGPVRGNAGISLVNVYDSKNTLYYDRKTLQRITMLPFLPSVFVKAEF